MEREHPIESTDIANKIAYIRMVAEVYSPQQARYVASALDLDVNALLKRHKEKLGLE